MPRPPHHHQERKSSFDIFVTYLNLCHSWGALRGEICCPSLWGWAPFLLGSLKFQLFNPREVLKTHPTPFLNQLSALEPILFYQDSPFKSVRELFQESCTCAHLVKRFFQTITGVFWIQYSTGITMVLQVARSKTCSNLSLKRLGLRDLSF